MLAKNGVVKRQPAENLEYKESIYIKKITYSKMYGLNMVHLERKIRY